MNEKTNIPFSISVKRKKQEKELFEDLHSRFCKGLFVKHANAPREWLQARGLNAESTGAGFNSGQVHNKKGHAEMKEKLKAIGYLKFSRRNSNGVDGHKAFGNYAITFPFRNRKGKVVNFYAIGIKDQPEEHALLNEEGVYPVYPHEMTTRLFIATDMLDAATLITAAAIQNRDSLLFIPGGKLLKQHEEAISHLSALSELIWIDAQSKNKVIMKDTTHQLRRIIKDIPVKQVVLPEKENLNQLFLREGSMGIHKLLESASLIEEVTEVEHIPLPILPIEEVKPIEEVVVFSPTKDAENTFMKQTFMPLLESQASEDPGSVTLEMIHEHKLLMRRPYNHYFVLGSLSHDIGSMGITLMVEEVATGRRERTKIDLYVREQIVLYAQQIAELYNQSGEDIEADLLLLTDLLEKYREKEMEQLKSAFQNHRQKHRITPEKQTACIQFLKGKNFMQGIDDLIQQAGVVGEENTRRLLFIIASTYKMSTPLHALVQGTSGSGKSHLINTIGDCFPPEDVISMTRVTSKSFYHYTKDELVDKLILIQDYDGMDEEAQFAFRELQSAGNITSSTTYKDKFGNLMSAVKTVRSHFASLLATTKAEVYYDNMSRSLISGVDESDDQTKRIITHQNRKLAGIIDNREEQKAKEFLQNCMRCILPMEVVNPFADKIYLPFEAKMLRRLNSHYQAFVKQITILHQYQRKKDDRGRLIAEPEDLHIACNIMFDAILLKVDDLDSSLRQFFDRVKEYVKEKSANVKEKEFQFNQRDVRLALNVSKTQCFRYFEELELLEYIQRTGGYANRGFKYKIVFWDDMEKIRDRVKEDLKKQLVLVVPASMEHQNPQQQAG
ncbi:MAG: dnaG 15 [Bacteroidetes bacterium]|jgi:hypothetical protein|nr:dnaG 15 [Bacteroidota bacterium]